MAIENKTKIKETILIIVGSLLIIIAFILFHYETILEVNNELQTKIKSEIYKEEAKKENNISIDIDVDYIEQDNPEVSKPSNPTPNYIAILEIPKINLQQGLLPKTSYYNNVNYHVEIHDLSDFPDVINGNLILAAHSGNSNIAYFKNLYKLNITDEAKIYYKNKVYTYKIVNIYNQVKKGSLNIYRDLEKTTLTLITCTKDNKASQTVYISELINVQTY